MTTNRPTIFDDTSCWQELTEHFKAVSQQHMRTLFESDPERFNKFHIEFNNILLDYSKNIINQETIPLLCQLAEQAKLGEWIERQFSGAKINHTEERAVLHTALRNQNDSTLTIDGENIYPKIKQQLEKIRRISGEIRSRRWLGATEQPITDVVNIGIGGSDLGPKMVTEALRPYAFHDLRTHFLSNLDENQINDLLEVLKPETTLFIISSKSFSTLETLINAEAAREWFLHTINDPSQLPKHFLAITSNHEAAISFGVHPDNILNIWDWVGGRYSIWSAIGLPVAISVGMDHFEALLNGAYEMDQHFRHTPFEKNIPVIMALLGIWYINFFDANIHAILPYDEHMKSFAAYLQQADMESNGKSVDRAGQAVNYHTGPVLFGEIGIKGQHAFYQLLHQGTPFVAADVLAPITDYKCIIRHHRALMANVFAQTEALMKGRTPEEARAELLEQGYSESQIETLLPYKVFPGNKPTNTILFETLDPKTLGSLIAMYEHKIFVQGVIWNVNSYDQWGVELGKILANTILSELEHELPVTEHDSSTNGLINFYKKLRKKTNT